MRDVRPVMLLTPIDEEDLAWYARERASAFVDSLARARRQVEEGRTRDHADLRREFERE